MKILVIVAIMVLSSTVLMAKEIKSTNNIVNVGRVAELVKLVSRCRETQF